MAKALAKGARITGPQRATLAADYAQRYAAGESIRKIATDEGRSFGFVHGILKENGVGLRGRGGATRGAKQAGPSGAAGSAAATKAPAAQASAAKKASSAKKASPARKTSPAKTTSAAKKTSAVKKTTKKAPAKKR